MKELIACKTSRNKIIVLLVLILCSVAFAFALEGICFAVAGPITTGSWFNPYRWGFVVACGFIGACFFTLRDNLKCHPEKIFLCIVLALTCYSSVAMGINVTSWDVGVHFRFMLEFASPDLTNELTVSEAEMVGPQDFYSSISDLENREAQLDAGDEVDAGTSLEGSLSKIYQRIGSLPGSILYLFLTLINVPFSIKYVSVPLLYALIYSFVTYFGMKKLRSGKMLYAVIALLPTAVFLASNYSYDYWLNAFALYSVASLVGILQKPDYQMTFGRSALLLAAFVVALGPKPIYFPLVLLCLLIPKNRFTSGKSSRTFRFATVMVSLLIAVSFLVPYFFVTGPGIGDTRGGSDVNSVEQIAFILSNPLEYARILLTFLAYYISIPASDGYIYLYAYLGFPTIFIWLLVLGALLLTTLTDKSESDKAVGTWRSRTLAISIFCVCIALVASALYVQYTPVGAETVAGCQARYLIPLLFALLVFLGGPKLAWPRSDSGRGLYNFGILALMAGVNMLGFWQVYVGLLH